MTTTLRTTATASTTAATPPANGTGQASGPPAGERPTEGPTPTSSTRAILTTMPTTTTTTTAGVATTDTTAMPSTSTRRTPGKGKGAGPPPSGGVGPNLNFWECDPGTFFDLSRSPPVCNNCTPGRYSAENGLSRCMLCAPGHFNTDLAMSSCQECPPGGSQPAPGQRHCFAAVGWFQNSTGGFVPCDESMITKRPGARSVEDCVCKEDTIFDNITANCAQCPTGLKCPGDEEYLGDGWPITLPGYHMLYYDEEAMNASGPVDVNQVRVFKCRSEEACPGWNRCHNGHDTSQPACGSCLSDYTYAGKTCRKCRMRDNFTMVFILAAVLLVLGLVVFSVNDNAARMQRSTLMMGTVLGILVTTLQIASVFGKLSIVWAHPLLDIFIQLGKLDVNFDLIRIGCLASWSAPVRYFLRLLCLPAMGAMAVLLALARRTLLRGSDRLQDRILPEVLNICGLVLVSFYITICGMLFTPVTCYAHPSGGSSVVDFPYVLCWQGEEHRWLLVLGGAFLCLLFLPSTTVCLWAIYHYKSAIALRHERFLHSFRFLFIRFKPGRQHWSLVLLVRSLAVALVPVYFIDAPATQLLLLSTIFAFFAAGEAWLRPWRIELATKLDIFIAASMVPILMCGAVSGDIKPTGDSLFWGGGVLCGVIALMIMMVLLHVILRRFRPFNKFLHFICHHKQGAAAQARVMKFILEQSSGESCFIDSDHLDDLDELYDVVRTTVTNLVVYLTRNTLTRPWCVGEIVTATINKKNVIVVRCADFVELGSEELVELPALLGTEGRCLTQYNITMQSAAQAIEALQLMDAVQVGPSPRAEDFRQAGQLIIKLSKRTRLLPTDSVPLLRYTRSGGTAAGMVRQHLESFTSFATFSSLDSSLPRKSKHSGVLLCSAVLDPEATAAAYILAKLLLETEKFTELMSAMVDLPDSDSPQAMLSVVNRSTQVVMLLSPAILVSTMCSLVLSEAVTQGIPLVPVILPGFQFPSESFFAPPDSTDSEGVRPDMRHMSTNSTLGASFCGASWRSLFTRIGVHLNTHASESILVTQGQEVAMRLRRNTESRASHAGYVNQLDSSRRTTKIAADYPAAGEAPDTSDTTKQSSDAAEHAVLSTTSDDSSVDEGVPGEVTDWSLHCVIGRSSSGDESLVHDTMVYSSGQTSQPSASDLRLVAAV